MLDWRYFWFDFDPRYSSVQVTTLFYSHPLRCQLFRIWIELKYMDVSPKLIALTLSKCMNRIKHMCCLMPAGTRRLSELHWKDLVQAS